MSNSCNIPSNWTSAEVGEICSLINGRPFKPSEWSKEGVPIIRIQNLNNAQATYNYFQGEIDEKYNVKPGELLFAWSGTPGTSFGAHIWSGPNAYLNQHIFRVIFPENLINKIYFRFALNERLNNIIARAHGGVGLRHITKKKFEQTEILLPPFFEQKRVVKIIEALQSRSSKARGALETIPPLLEKFRQSVLASAFRGDLTADWRAQNPDIEPATKLLERIRKERRKRWEENELAKMKAKGKTPKDGKWKKKYKEPEPVDTTDLPELPEGWCWESLEELSWNSSYGTSTKCDYEAEGTPVLRIPNVVNGSIDQEDLKFSFSELFLQDEDYLSLRDLLVIRTNGSRNLIGRGALITNLFSEPTFFASYLIRFRLVGDLRLCQWLSSVWHSPIIRNKIEQLASTSAGQYNINLTKLNSIVFPIPPKEEIRNINLLVENAFEKEANLSTLSTSILKNFNKLVQSILSKAFRGELVPQDPNDEPASQLLKRIKQEKASREAEKKERESNQEKGNPKK